MKKKMILSALAVAMVLSFASCGRPEKPDSSASKTKVSTQKTPEINGYRMKIDISDVKGNDDLSGLTGCFIETTDGEETGYISINDDGAVYVGKDSNSVKPLGIEVSKDGLMVYRISRPPVDLFNSYSFDGTTLKYEDDGQKIEWEKVEYFLISGTYNCSKLDGNGSEIWTFNEDGTGTSVDPSQQEVKTNEFKFTQDKDKVIIEESDGKKTEYTYIYDRVSLVLESDKVALSMSIA
ncbi:MAG: hypothetical protein K2F81_07200 [Ruminococcus sp.]|nr:hypothetical protein [Ruminococcus sp.]